MSRPSATIFSSAVGLFALAAVVLGFSINPTPVTVADGQRLYMGKCMSCHQMDGAGIPGAFPPLTNSEWVSRSADQLVSIILHGVQGEIEVDGMVYGGMMPPWNTFLNDDEVAALSQYVRAEFADIDEEITPEDVARIREATAERTQPWTAEELVEAYWEVEGEAAEGETEAEGEDGAETEEKEGTEGGSE
ncbi:MAG: cytochrome c [Bacteroidota bacterium]